MYASGPGFFIFFHETETSAGGGEPTLIIYTKEQKPVEVEKKIFLKVAKKVKKYKKTKKKVTEETIYNIAQTMADTFSAKPTMDRYGITYEEAVSRYKEIVLDIADIVINDEEEALILIVANI